MRGEHPSQAIEIVRACGSSPRARGTPAPQITTRSARPVHPRVRGERRRAPTRCRRPSRFIPACAGNALGCSAPPATKSVHPRVRGERSISRIWSGAEPGSSPRARGTRQHSHHSDRRMPVHPRVRGERQTITSLDAAVRGSSPRARGTRRPIRAGAGFWRFIPACAGNA